MARKKPKMATEFVLDCSVAVAWFFEDETDAYAESVQESLTSARAVVPALWFLEVANVLLVGERRRRTTAAKADQFLVLLGSLPITADDETTTRAWTDTLRIARSQQLSVYDAAYLELASRRGLPLATLDGKLRIAATEVGVKEFKP